MATRSNYDREQLLGQGPETNVYRARSRQLHHDVAIRELREEHRTNKSALQDFTHRARAWVKFQDEALIKIFDSDEASAWVVQELMTNNAAGIIRHGPVSIEFAFNLLVRALSALDVIHRAGFLHNNLKLTNLLFDVQQRVKLSDGFSVPLARKAEIPQQRGRMKYLAPELLTPSFGPVGAASDLYSLAFVTLELLAGPGFEQRFRGISGNAEAKDTAWYRWHTSTLEKLPPTDVFLGIEAQPLTRVLDRLLQKEVGQRYTQANETLAELGVASARGLGGDQQSPLRPGLVPSQRAEVEVLLTFASGPRCGEECLVNREVIAIGEGEQCQLELNAKDYPEAAGQRLVIRYCADGWQVQQAAGSGLIVNSHRALEASIALRSGDMIRFSEQGPDFQFVVRQSGLRDWMTILRERRVPLPNGGGGISASTKIGQPASANPSAPLPPHTVKAGAVAQHNTAHPNAPAPPLASRATLAPPLPPHSVVHNPPKPPLAPTSAVPPQQPLSQNHLAGVAASDTAVANPVAKQNWLDWKSWDKNTLNWVILSIGLLAVSLGVIFWPSKPEPEKNPLPQTSAEKSSLSGTESNSSNNPQ